MIKKALIWTHESGGLANWTCELGLWIGRVNRASVTKFSMMLMILFLFSETIQTGILPPHPSLLLTSGLPPPPPSFQRAPAIAASQTTRLPILNGDQRRRASSLLLTSSGHFVNEKSTISKVEKLSPCCRYRKPAIVSLFSVGFIMIITCLVLYWNYHETIHRRMNKKQVCYYIACKFV